MKYNKIFLKNNDILILDRYINIKDNNNYNDIMIIMITMIMMMKIMIMILKKRISKYILN